MNAKEADRLAMDISAALESDRQDIAHSLLEPTLSERTPFRYLDRIGAGLGTVQIGPLYTYLDHIAADQTEGGWVVIAAALWQQYDLNPPAVFERCRGYITRANVWYAADIFAERVPGPALVEDFDTALNLMENWRVNENRWIRRSVGVSAHFWAKRSRGEPSLTNNAQRLLHFLTPMFGEWEMDATKGIAWGLKTLGRNYPEPVTEWLVDDILPGRPRYRAHMLRKATLYLTEEQRDTIYALSKLE